MRDGCFPLSWKKARLVLIRKSDKPLEPSFSYRPLSMVNAHLALDGLSENQLGFRKGNSTMDAIEKVLDLVNRTAAVPLRRRKLCAIVSIDVANAFNSMPWGWIGEAKRQNNIPFYLIRMIRDYLRERRLHTDVGSIIITRGIPQGSVIGPILWNIF